MNRKNFIDGLPASYDYNYVIKTEKHCILCCKTITLVQIENNSIICTENFDFFHKDCIDASEFETIYSKPKDPTSMVKLVRKKTDEIPVL